MVKRDLDTSVGYQPTHHSIRFEATLGRAGRALILRAANNTFAVRIEEDSQSPIGHPILYRALRPLSGRKSLHAIKLEAQQRGSEIFISPPKSRDPIPVEPDPANKEGHEHLHQVLSGLFRRSRPWTELSGTFTDMPDISPSDPHQRRAMSAQSSRRSSKARAQVFNGGLPGSGRR